MSENFRTEEEQLEVLRNWWRESGKSTVVSIAAAIAVVFGWQFWQKQTQAEQEAASAVYQNLILAVSSEDAKASTVAHLAETLREEFAGSSYAYFAALYQSQLAVDAKDLDAAEQHLQWLLQQDASEEIRLQAQLRLARVNYAQGDLDEALQLLDIDAKGFAAAYQEVKGDVLRAQGKKQQAKTAYLQAQSLGLSQQLPSQNPLLDMKLQQLESELSAEGEANNG
jgi:predicted negative regulator of RcsB-dependent stress response